MNIVCLNCEAVRNTEDPRVKFCGKACRHRYNMKKLRSKPKKETVGIEALKEMIKGIENKPKAVPASPLRSQASPVVAETKRYSEFNQEWRPPDVFVPFVKKNLDKLW